MFRLEKATKPSDFGSRDGGFRWFSENISTLKVPPVPEGSPTACLGLAGSERLKGVRFRAMLAVRRLALLGIGLFEGAGKAPAGSGGHS